MLNASTAASTNCARRNFSAAVPPAAVTKLTLHPARKPSPRAQGGDALLELFDARHGGRGPASVRTQLAMDLAVRLARAVVGHRDQGVELLAQVGKALGDGLVACPLRLDGPFGRRCRT